MLYVAPVISTSNQLLNPRPPSTLVQQHRVKVEEPQNGDDVGPGEFDHCISAGYFSLTHDNRVHLPAIAISDADYRAITNSEYGVGGFAVDCHWVGGLVGADGVGQTQRNHGAQCSRWAVGVGGKAPRYRAVRVCYRIDATVVWGGNGGRLVNPNYTAVIGKAVEVARRTSHRGLIGDVVGCASGVCGRRVRGCHVRLDDSSLEREG